MDLATCSPKQDEEADHLRPARTALTGAERKSSLTPRDEMLLFEFVGALFQFEEREPELAPLFQLPPSITA